MNRKKPKAPPEPEEFITREEYRANRIVYLKEQLAKAATSPLRYPESYDRIRDILDELEEAAETPF